LPGMDCVDELAEYLVELRNGKGLTLTNQQASTIVGLWQNLEQHDKDRILRAQLALVKCKTLHKKKSVNTLDESHPTDALNVESHAQQTPAIASSKAEFTAQTGRP